MEIPPEWILGSIVALGGIIATMAQTIDNSLSKQIDHQNRIIENLQDDVDRLSKGCGVVECLWRER